MTTTDTDTNTNTNAVVTIPPPQQVAAELIAAGLEIATGHGMVGSSERRYAALMSASFPGWHMLADKDDSNEAKLIKAGPKAKLFQQLKDAKHTNPSTVWARVRKYAGEATATAEGEGTEGEDGTGNSKREIRARIREELAKLIKAIDKDQYPAEDLRAVKTYLELAIIKATPAAPTAPTEKAE